VTSAAHTVRAAIASGRHQERTVRALVFRLVLLLCVAVGLLTLATLLIDVFRDGI
jgi:hypothetical protein